MVRPKGKSAAPETLDPHVARVLAKAAKSTERAGMNAAERARQRWQAQLPAARHAMLEGLDSRLDVDGWRRIVENELDDTFALMAVRRWTQEAAARPILLLLGGVRVGKSLAATWWLTRSNEPSEGDITSERVPAVRGPIRAFPDLVRDAHSKFEPTRERYERVVANRYLVVDEIGTEVQDAPQASATLLEIVDRRSRPNRGTIMIGNLTPTQLRERYPDERLHRRLAVSALVVELREKGVRRATR
jgi:hypothetical protein